MNCKNYANRILDTLWIKELQYIVNEREFRSNLHRLKEVRLDREPEFFWVMC